MVALPKCAFVFSIHLLGNEAHMTGNRKGVIGRILELEPLLTRGTIVSVFAVVGMVLNHHFANGTVEYSGNIVLAAFGLLTAIVSRSKVTPNAKVINYTPNPSNRNQIESGGAQDF